MFSLANTDCDMKLFHTDSAISSSWKWGVGGPEMFPLVPRIPWIYNLSKRYEVYSGVFTQWAISSCVSISVEMRKLKLQMQNTRNGNTSYLQQVSYITKKVF